MRRTTQLRQLLSQGRLLVSPFTYDAFTAKIAEAVGFPIVYMSGFGTSMSRGYPDVGLLTMSEMVENARRIALTVSVPVIADADTGYGNPLNAARTVREYEQAGVAGVHLEDQVFPKKCGFFEGKQVIPMEEHIAKLRAAMDARTDPDFLIIARTDALAVNGWDDTLRRCRAYHKSGADMVFIDGIKTREDLELYARELRDIPRLYNGDLASTQEVERLGFKVMIHRGSMLAVYKAVRGVMEELKQKGVVDKARYATREEVAGLLGLDKVYEMEKRYTAVG
ncbi:MAG: isocitrate lyase/PEP mutase family protein [Chloroflexi bacterium]|nr:isocitrate lyase/PEP mutase family protein [Chloroflexota bacterium]